MKKFACVAMMMVYLAGCASRPDKIGTMYISPLQYQPYDGQQVAAELERVNRRISELEGSLNKKADNDSTKAFIGTVLFWPTLFFLDGNGPEAQEYARLKGEREALERVAVQKGYMASATR